METGNDKILNVVMVTTPFWKDFLKPVTGPLVLKKIRLVILVHDKDWDTLRVHHKED